MGVFSPQISAREMVPLCRQLATSYSAGIPIIQSLDTVSEQMKDGTVRKVLRTMSDDLRPYETVKSSVHLTKCLPNLRLVSLAEPSEDDAVQARFAIVLRLMRQ